jgi:hypothetical protein
VTGLIAGTRQFAAVKFGTPAMFKKARLMRADEQRTSPTAWASMRLILAFQAENRAAPAGSVGAGAGDMLDGRVFPTRRNAAVFPIGG